MTPERWQQVKSIIEQALEREPAQRRTFLAEVCAGDKELYNEAEQLIAADEEVEGFLEQPAHPSFDSKRTLPMRAKQDPGGLKIGEIFLGKYEVIRLIGRGGMGSVYQARHIELNTLFAIKVLNTSLTQDDEAIERFKREARTAAKLEHPHTVRVFDYGAQDMTCYLIMEHLKGESLRERLKRKKRLPLAEVLEFAEQVCDVLSFVHDRGIIHRDLKPDNIYFHVENEKEMVKLLDFGIAKLSTFTYSAESLTLTNPGSVFGTPQYMSPEQCQSKSLDGRSDIYSLGIIIYEMLAGRRPFESDSPLSYMYAHVHNDPPALNTIASDVTSEISRAIMKSLCKEVEQRYQTAADLYQALMRAVNMASAPTLELRQALPTSVNRSISFVNSSRNNIYLLAMALILAIIVPLGYWQYNRFNAQPDKPPVNTVNTINTVTNNNNQTTGKPFEPEIKVTDERFVLIMGGNVRIGRAIGDCPNVPNCKITEDEAPEHAVTLAPYYLSKYEVTNQEYFEFISSTKHRAPEHWKENRYAANEGAVPVTRVSWTDAVKYCEWRSKREGIPYRLPTEAEWEHAARGNDLRLFPWGDVWAAQYAVNSENSIGRPLPIDKAPNNTFDRSANGIFALAGNVAEWTSSKFLPYVGSNFKPQPNDFNCRIVRGGTFLAVPGSLRTTVRTWLETDSMKPDLGFRLAIPATKKAVNN